MPNEVLVLGEYGIKNGGENSFLAVVSLLQKKGWTYTAAVPTNTPFEYDLAKHGIPNLGLSFHDQNGVRLSQSEIREQLTELVHNSKPDLVHCNSLSTSRLMGPVAKAMNVPSVGYLRDILKLSKTAIADINQLNRVVAVSNATRDWHLGQGMDPTRTVVIYNGVDNEIFHPDVVPADLSSLGIDADDNILLFVGQIGMRKGVDFAIDMFSKVAGRLTDTHLVMVGERNSQKQEAIKYEKTAVLKARNSGFDVHWLGRRDDIPSLMQRSTLLVHTARQEPLGRVLLEALASGLPFVATDVGGTREIVDGMEKFKLLSNDIEEFSNRVLELLENEEQRAEVKAQFRAQSIRKFSLDDCANKLDKLFSSLQS